MQGLELVKPSAEYREEIAAYRLEFLQAGDSMDGTARLETYENPEDWLKWLALTARAETCPKGLVPNSEFLCVRVADRRVVGMIDIRHTLNDYLLRFGGHIGYSIRPSERGKGYAKEQLRLALALCASLGLRRVLITCDAANEASRRTILSAGGKLENEVLEPSARAIVQRYWVDCP